MTESWGYFERGDDLVRWPRFRSGAHTFDDGGDAAEALDAFMELAPEEQEKRLKEEGRAQQEWSRRWQGKRSELAYFGCTACRKLKRRLRN
jgi:hypothetical protein